MSDTDTMWELWGKQNPYYGVLSSDEFRNENLSSHKDKFFESGAEHIAGVLTDIEKRFGSVPRGKALDFGCGVGRLLIPLASEFASVTGMDISQSMLKEARSNLESRDISNVDLRMSDDELTELGDAKFDFLHTVIVLQHIPVQRGYRIIESLLKHASADAAVHLHFSVKRNLSLAKRLIYFAKNKIPVARFLFNILQRKRLNEPTMQMNEYDFLKVMRLFQNYGFNQVVVELHEHLVFSTYSCYSKRAC